MTNPRSTLPALAAPAPSVRRSRQSRRRSSTSRTGAGARAAGQFARWCDQLEALVKQRRGELMAVGAGVLVGWAGVVVLAVSSLG